MQDTLHCYEHEERGVFFILHLSKVHESLYEGSRSARETFSKTATMRASSIKEIPIIKGYEKGCGPMSAKNLKKNY